MSLGLAKQVYHRCEGSVGQSLPAFFKKSALGGDSMGEPQGSLHLSQTVAVNPQGYRDAPRCEWHQQFNPPSLPTAVPHPPCLA